jgi:hypothetical protein
LSEQSKSAPSQGIATTYEALNVHTEPDAHSPSFLQLKEGEKVEVIGHRVAPRLPPAPPKAPPAMKPQNRKTSKSGKKSKEKEIPAPPMPAPPKLPGDWRELSQLAADPAPVPNAPRPTPMDDWSLIRNAAGRDGKIVKKSWLWTTIESGRQPRDFDSFRVFVWSLRRHRYETAHIERNLSGFFPVLTHPVAAPRARGVKDAVTGKDAATGKVPGFSILIEKQDGLRYRRNYAFVENRVRFSGEEQAEAASAPSTPEVLPSPAEPDRPEAAPMADETWSGRVKRRIDAWRQGLFGH